MYNSYHSKNKKDPYSLKDSNDYQIVYSEKYNSILVVQYDSQKEKPASKKDLESLVEKIEEKLSNNKESKIINLEDRVNKISNRNSISPKDYHPEENEENIIYYPNSKTYEKNSSKESIGNTIDPKSGARIIYVPSSSLPSGPGYKVLGMYNPSNHTIYISKDLSEYQRSFVYHHEVAHALGIRNEIEADAYASRQVGYNLRSPSEAYASQRRAA